VSASATVPPILRQCRPISFRVFRKSFRLANYMVSGGGTERIRPTFRAGGSASIPLLPLATIGRKRPTLLDSYGIGCNLARPCFLTVPALCHFVKILCFLGMASLHALLSPGLRRKTVESGLIATDSGGH